MIIRMTVHDNDFQDIMSGFVHNLYNGLTSVPIDLYTKDTFEGPDSDVFDEYIQCSIRVKSIFDDYVTHHEPNKNAADYLRNHFEASIIGCVTDRDENGEAWYWFQTSGCVMNQ